MRSRQATEHLEPASRRAARAARVSELLEASLGAVLQLAVARLKQQAAQHRQVCS